MHVLPHTAGDSKETREEHYTVLVHYGSFHMDNTWEIMVNQPTPISYHEALTDLPKVVHSARKLPYLSLGKLTQDVYLSLFLAHPLPSILLPDSSSNTEWANLPAKP